MSSLRTIKQRKNTIQSTRKITAAMKLIAATKLKKTETNALDTRPYAQNLDALAQQLLKSPQEIPPQWQEGDPQHPDLYLIFMSNRGLCGSYNGKIIRTLRQFVQANSQPDAPQPIAFCVGKKAEEAARKVFNFKVEKFILSTDSPRFFRAKQWINGLFEKSFQRCFLVYTHFHSVLQQEVIIQQLIPLAPPPLDPSPDMLLYEFDPKAPKVIDALLKQYIMAQIYQAFWNSLASEQAARMMAMDTATRNADEIIQELALEYNRLRQASITKELIEIISGVEAAA